MLADGRVRQIGDAVAAVAATSPEAAAQALSLIRVSYRLLPAIVDPAEALKEGAPLIHDNGNLLAEKEARWGDAEAGLAQADLVVDETYTTPFVEHAYLEPEAALAYRDDEGRLVVRSATQYSHLHRRAVAETMGLPLEQVRILPTVVGGAFGAKTDISCECVAALLALKTGQPVKIVYSRAESFASTTKRHPFRMRCRTGVTRDGRLTALAADVLADTGAYASAGPGIMVRAFVSLVGPYQFPNVAIHGRVVYTNNTTGRRHARLRRAPGGLRHRVADGHHGRQAGHRPSGVPVDEPPQVECRRGNASGRGAGGGVPRNHRGGPSLL